MTFFVDTNIIVYAASKSDYQVPCETILTGIGNGTLDGRISVAVLEEIWHLELRGRIPGLKDITSQTMDLFAPVLAVTEEIFRLAVSLNSPNLGANDRIHGATCLANEIPTIVSADDGFDGIKGLRRTDPLNARQLRRLISGGVG